MTSAQAALSPTGSEIRRAGPFALALLIAALAAAGLMLLVPMAREGFLLMLAVVATLGLIIVILYPWLAAPLVIGVVFTNLAGNAVNLYGAPSLVGLALPLLLVVPVWRALFTEGRPLVFPPVLWAMLAFMLIRLIGVLVADDAASAIANVGTTAVEGLLLTLLLINAIRTRESLRLALVALVAAAALVGTVSVIQQVTGSYYTRYFGLAQLSDDSFVTDEDSLSGGTLQPRLGGQLGEKNYYAQVMLMVIPIGAALALTTRRRWRQLALIAGTMLIGAGMVLTFSRGAAVAVACLIAIGLIMRILPIRLVLASALGGALLLAIFPAYLTRIATLGDATGLTTGFGTAAPDRALQGRAGENAAAIAAILERPLLGLGPGEFPAHYQRYARRAAVVDLHGTERAAHSLFLGMAAESGLLGTAAFLGVLLAAAIPLLRIRQRPRAPGDASLAVGLFLGLLGYVLAGMFLDLAYARYLWLLIALATAAGVILARTDGPESASAAANVAGAVRAMPQGV